MKLSRDWLSDYVDLTGISDDDLARAMTDIGHAVEGIEKHGDDTVLEAEVTSNRVDAMSHRGMAREVAAALGRDVLPGPAPLNFGAATTPVRITIEATELCSRYTGLVVRGVTVKPSPEIVRRRLEAVGLRPINNVVDVTNYVMLASGHPLHAFDLDKLSGATIIVRAGKKGETVRSLDGEMRQIDPQTVVIADAERPVALGGVIGGAESEIGNTTQNILLECAWFDPATIRRTARRLGMKTDASYRFERRVDPNDTVEAAQLAAALIVEYGGGTAEPPVDVVSRDIEPRKLRLRAAKMHEASGGSVGHAYALELFRRLGFGAAAVDDGVDVTVPTYRGDIAEEMDLVEEVLRFFGLDRVPSVLPRLTTGDTRPNVTGDVEDELRRVLIGSGLTEIVSYSFIHPDHNLLFSDEKAITITNALSENVAAMRLSLLPGLLESVVFNRSYGNRDGALFEVGRTYHRDGDAVRERHRIGIVMFGHIGSHWGDPKRPVDYFDIKGVIEQIAEKLHVSLAFDAGDDGFLRKGKRALARLGDRRAAWLGFLDAEILQRFGIKGDVAAAEIDLEALLGDSAEWKMSPVARYPGVPMVLGLLHEPDLEYGRLIETIRSLDVPHLHEVGLRDRYVAEGESTVKTLIGMWYQAFDRSLTQDEVTASHQQLATRLSELLPVRLLKENA